MKGSRNTTAGIPVLYVADSSLKEDREPCRAGPRDNRLMDIENEIKSSGKGVQYAGEKVRQVHKRTDTNQKNVRKIPST